MGKKNKRRSAVAEEALRASLCSRALRRRENFRGGAPGDFDRRRRRADRFFFGGGGVSEISAAA